MSVTAYVADKIFTGEEWLTDQAVVVDINGIIDSIVAKEAIPTGTKIEARKDCFIAPAFIDLQIYGAHKKLLAVEPTIETLEETLAYCRSGGANYFQPTVATNTFDVFFKSIDAVKAYWKAGKPGVIGLHIEGPWISKAKRGAHIEELIHAPTLQEAKDLLEYGKGVITMITVAPEVCSAKVIELIKSYGVVVSAGHSNATFVQATQAFDTGIPAATHLFNAMSPLQHREPGMVGAIMQHAKVMCSIIPDGYHVDFAAISIAKKIMDERLFIITDAVTETNEGYYPHQLEGDKYVSNGTLSGSALTMNRAVKNCVEKVGIELSEALRMASLYPARLMGLDNKIGSIKKGLKAQLIFLDKEINVVE
jgi:N-acetylglucosamine-6-phosphate deacetylase